VPELPVVSAASAEAITSAHRGCRPKRSCARISAVADASSRGQETGQLGLL